MKTTHLYASIIGAGMFAISSAFAGPWDGNPDMESSILNELDRPAYVGTGLQETRARVYIYGALGSSFLSHDIDQTGFVVGTSGPEKGHGDRYGSVLVDVGALPVR